MRKHIAFFILCVFIFSFVSCKKDESRAPKKDLSKKASVEESVESAYIFGFPLVLMHMSGRVMTNPVEGSGNVPLNRFRHTGAKGIKNGLQAFADADFFHSHAWLELGKEPLVFEIPDMGDRYAFFTVMDAWTNVISSPGKRTSGTKAQKYLIARADWKGEVPEGMKLIKSSGNMAKIDGRIQADSAEDGKNNVSVLQKKLKLIPLSRYSDKDYKSEEKGVDLKINMDDPVKQVFSMDIAEYFNLLNALMADNPPDNADNPFLESVKYLKIAPGEEFDLSIFGDETKEIIKNIPDMVRKSFEETYFGAQPVNGWYFLPFAAASYVTDYKKRALNVYKGVNINLPADAVWLQSFTDADNNKFDGSNNYVLHLDKSLFPAAGAFWSISAYNGKSLLGANPLNRYSVSDRKTLKFNKDGSVDIYIQRGSPGKDKESNWLPVPEGVFSLVFKAYRPDEKLIKKQWDIPAAKKR